MPTRPAGPPDPPLSDGVILLRPWTLQDVPELAAAANADAEIARWLDQIPQPYAEGQAIETTSTFCATSCAGVVNLKHTHA